LGKVTIFISEFLIYVRAENLISEAEYRCGLAGVILNAQNKYQIGLAKVKFELLKKNILVYKQRRVIIPMS
jgi:hypothetical protein